MLIQELKDTKEVIEDIFSNWKYWDSNNSYPVLNQNVDNFEENNGNQFVVNNLLLHLV
jgi:hypothetical protein